MRRNFAVCVGVFVALPFAYYTYLSNLDPTAGTGSVYYGKFICDCLLLTLLPMREIFNSSILLNTPNWSAACKRTNLGKYFFLQITVNCLARAEPVYERWEKSLKYIINLFKRQFIKCCLLYGTNFVSALEYQNTPVKRNYQILFCWKKPAKICCWLICSMLCNSTK